MPCCENCGYGYSTIFSYCPDCGSSRTYTPPSSDEENETALNPEAGRG